MGYSNQEDQKYVSVGAITADINYAKLDTRTCDTAYFTVVWTGTTSGDAVVKLQDGQDGTKWFDMTGKTLTLSSTSGSGVIRVFSVPTTGQDALVAPLIRAVLTHNTESSGTVTITYFLKGDR